MKKIYYLSTCSTCKRIMKDLKTDGSFEKQDIKTEKITAQQLETMAKQSGSYESLFNKRAMKYKALNLTEKPLLEKDYKKYILEEYTFLKRPVILFSDKIFIGNSPKIIAAAKAMISRE